MLDYEKDVRQAFLRQKDTLFYKMKCAQKRATLEAGAVQKESDIKIKKIVMQLKSCFMYSWGKLTDIYFLRAYMCIFTCAFKINAYSMYLIGAYRRILVIFW